jgi:NAD+ synthase
MKNGLIIDVKKEKERIVTFLRKTFQEQCIENAVIGLSGGIDSATSFYLLSEALAPEHIFVENLYYFKSPLFLLEHVLKEKGIPEENIHVLSIQQSVDEAMKALKIESNEENKFRIGNIAARMRMIFLYDLAKKTQSLVCGTENKSENFLGYFTRFGDQASDIEPIEHLYKTQVYQLAEYLGIPDGIIKQRPTAGLWHGQTDEGEFGFTYAEADQVLYYYFDKHLSAEEIKRKGFENTHVIIERCKRNEFKHKVPYHL